MFEGLDSDFRTPKLSKEELEAIKLWVSEASGGFRVEGLGFRV